MLHLTLENVDYAVIDTFLPPPVDDSGQPVGPPLPTKLLRFVDPESKVVIDVPLPSVAPHGVEVGPDFKPPAEDIGAKLLGDTPRIVTAPAGALAGLDARAKAPMAGRGRPKR